MLTGDFIAILDAKIAQLQGMRAAVARERPQLAPVSPEVRELIAETVTLLSTSSGCTDSWAQQRDTLLQRARLLLADGQATAGQQAGTGEA